MTEPCGWIRNGRFIPNPMKNALSRTRADKHEYVPVYMEEPIPSDHIAMPDSIEKAKAMAVIGLSWLEANAPEVLKPKLREE